MYITGKSGTPVMKIAETIHSIKDNELKKVYNNNLRRGDRYVDLQPEHSKCRY